MDTKVKDIIDLDFDPDILSSFLENLSLEPSIPDLSDSLSILENEPVQNGLEKNADDYCTSKGSSVKEELQSDSEDKYNEDIKNCIKIEKVENCIGLKTPSSSYVETFSNVSVKKETTTKVCDCVKTEQSSDSDDDDDSNELLERGGPEKIRRRAYKRKQYERPARTINAAEIDPRTARFLSSGRIVENNFSNNLPENNNSINCFSCSVSSPDFGYVPSPESGYDTSRSSGIYSPSPPATEFHQTFNEDAVNEKRQIQSIFESLIELERSLESSQTDRGHHNIPILNDVSDDGYIEQASFLDDISYDDYIELVQEFFNLPMNDGESLRNDNGDMLGLETNEITSSDSSSDYIPFENLSEDLETSSNLQVQNNNCTVPQHENFQSSSNVPVLRRLNFKLRDVAKAQLRYSDCFDSRRYVEETGKLLREVKRKEPCMEEISIIEIEEENGAENLNRTNLQNAVLNSNIEKVFSLVEMQKKYSLSLFLINHRDAHGKTALDYAIEKKMPLIVDYLKENIAKPRI